MRTVLRLLPTGLCGVLASQRRGFGTYGATVFPRLDVTGHVILNGTTVRGPLSAMGQLELWKATLKAQLIARGMVTASKTVVEGTTDITGQLSADACKFLDTVSVASNRTVLKGTQLAKNLIIKEVPKSSGDQTVELDGSIISGYLLFDSGKGKVIVRNNSRIEGGLFGGSIVSSET